MTDYSNLFGWWISSISFNIIFVVLASVYLYRRRNRGPMALKGNRIARWAGDFAFVWLLFGLLILYVASIGGGNYWLFAGGNIVVEIFLVVYVMQSGKSHVDKGP